MNINKIKSYISTITNKISSFTITLDDMTIGKLINDQLQQDKRIKYAGIYQPSYLEQFIKIKIELDDMYDINPDNINVIINDSTIHFIFDSFCFNFFSLHILQINKKAY